MHMYIYTSYKCTFDVIEHERSVHTRSDRNSYRVMLAVLYGLEKFHYYAHGRFVAVEFGHTCMPLEAICKKHFASASPRTSRMVLT